MSHSQGKKVQQKERQIKGGGGDHMWHIKWEQSKRKRELSFSYGKCFPYKSFFLTSPPRFLLECSIFKKWLLFHVSSLSVQTETEEMGMTDKTGSGGQGSFERWEFGLILKEQSLSPSRPMMQKPFFIFTVAFPQKPTTVTSFSSWQIHTHMICSFHKNPFQMVVLFYYLFLRFYTRISSSSSSKKEEKLLSSSGGALKVALSVSPA